MESLKKIQDASKERDSFLANFTESGKELLREFHKEIFSSHPDLQVVRWTQYTPYFNDGEPCVFGVYDPEVSLTEHEYKGNNKSLVFEDDETDYVGDERLVRGQDGRVWCLNYSWKAEGPTGEICSLIRECHEQMQDCMRELFGDGVQVTLFRSGDINVEDYSHV